MGWPDFLDEVENRLVDVDRTLIAGGPTAAPFVLPDDLGPLPPELRERATRALRTTIAKQVEVEVARDRMAEALRQGRRPKREPAAYFDRRV